MKRVKWFAVGALLIVAPYLMAPSGGFPFKPTFGGVHITNGNVGSFSQLSLDTPASNAVSNYLSFNNGGTTKAVVLNERSAGGNCSGDSVDDLCLRSISGSIYLSSATQAGRAGLAPIVCTTACSLTGMVVGQTAIITKTSNTSRASTSTSTVDPDLVYTNVPNGTYHIWYTLNFSSGAGGVRMSPVLSGTYNFAGAQNCFGIAAAVSTFSSSGVTVCNSTSGLLETSQGTGTASGANAIAIFWAQSSSNVANTTLVAGSDIIVQRIQ